MSATSEEDDESQETNSLADELDGLHDKCAALDARVVALDARVAALDNKEASGWRIHTRGAFGVLALTFAVGWLAAVRFDRRCHEAR